MKRKVLALAFLAVLVSLAPAVMAAPFDQPNTPSDLDVVLGYAKFVVPALFVLVLVFSNAFVVHQQEARVIERLGKFSRVATAGFNLKFPFIDAKKEPISLRQQEIEIPVDTKTKDNVFMEVVPAVQFVISDPEKAFYKLTNLVGQMKTYVFDQVRSSVPGMNMNEVFENKVHISEQVRTHLGEKMGQFGITIVDVPIKNFKLPSEVQAAMNQVVTQQRLREAANEKGEADKILVVKAAEAKKAQDILHGEGVAGQRQAIAEGVEKSVKGVADAADMTPREATTFLALMQYLDAITKIGENAKHVVFLPSNPGAVGSLNQELLATLSAAGAENAGAPPARPKNGRDGSVAAAA